MKSELDRFCEANNITCESVYGGNKGPMPDGYMLGTHPYCVTLRRRNGDTRRQLSVDFFMGPAHCSEPTAADVMSCLLMDVSTMDSTDGFEDWAGALGYDMDSRKAERIYRACAELAPRVGRFMGNLLVSAMEMQH